MAAVAVLPAQEQEKDGFETMSVRDLKSYLTVRGVAFGDCIEKADLVKRAREAVEHPWILEGGLPPLPSPDEITLARFGGPIDVSNWLILGKLIGGGYPGEVSSMTKVEVLVDAGVTAFVCLQTPSELTRFNSYMAAIEELRKQRAASGSAPLPAITFVNLPIEDASTVDDATALAYTRRLLEVVNTHAITYLHCWGGHGRTGTIASILLGKLYGLTGPDALDLNERLHACRIAARGSSPEMPSQRDQVRRLLPQPPPRVPRDMSSPPPLPSAFLNSRRSWKNRKGDRDTREESELEGPGVGRGEGGEEEEQGLGDLLE